MRLQITPGSILDFDLENRPLSYLGHDFTTAEITAIAASFGEDYPVYCWCLGELGNNTRSMLEGFVAMYDKADIVTGHYITKHDLPIINGALLEFGMRPLSPKLVSDTKLDLIHIKDLSGSQESLGAMFGLDEPKIHMTQADWRAANRLEATHLTRERVIGDVRQHMAMRKRLLAAGALGPARMWYPDGKRK